MPLISACEQLIPAWWSSHRRDWITAASSLPSAPLKPPDRPPAAMRRITGKAKDETLIEMQSATDTQPGGNERNTSPLPLRGSQDHEDVRTGSFGLIVIEAVTSVLMG